eukprot:UN00785
MSRTQCVVDPFAWIDNAIKPTSNSKKNRGKSLKTMTEKQCQTKCQPANADPSQTDVLDYLFNENIDTNVIRSQPPAQAMDLNYLFDRNDVKTHQTKNINVKSLSTNPMDSVINEYGQWIEVTLKNQIVKIKTKLRDIQGEDIKNKIETQPQKPKILFMPPPSYPPPPPTIKNIRTPQPYHLSAAQIATNNK